MTKTARLKQLRELRRIARTRGGRLLTKEYANGRTKMLWRCEARHEWLATPENIKQGSWCRRCYFKRRGEELRGDITIQRARAKAHKGLCLSRIYIDAHTMLKWKCLWGHMFFMTPANVSQGKWCPICRRREGALKRKATVKEIRKLAKDHNAKLLSKSYEHIDAPLDWQCLKCKCKWQRSLHNAKRTKWCPRSRGKPQAAVRHGCRPARLRRR